MTATTTAPMSPMIPSPMVLLHTEEHLARNSPCMPRQPSGAPARQRARSGLVACTAPRRSRAPAMGGGIRLEPRATLHRRRQIVESIPPRCQSGSGPGSLQRSGIFALSRRHHPDPEPRLVHAFGLDHGPDESGVPYTDGVALSRGQGADEPDMMPPCESSHRPAIMTGQCAACRATLRARPLRNLL